MKSPVLAVPALLLALGAPGAALAQRGTAAVPANTVVRVRLDEQVSSRDARVGERVSATIAGTDRSGFPADTRFEGTVTEVQRSSEERPGILDMEFRGVVLPDGQRVAVTGSLASLADNDVRRAADGRVESRRRSGEKLDLKWVGYGAGAGAVLATIFGGNFLKGALLGGLGGAVYGYLNRDKDRGSFKEVELERGQEFGIRLDQRVAFADRTSYRYIRTARLDTRGRADDRPETGPADDRFENGRVLGEREEFRYGNTTVRVNDRPLTFGEARPLDVNGSLYVPLAPIARAAGLRFEHFRGDDTFRLHTRDGVHSGRVGETDLRGDFGEERLEAGPLMINGEIYVPTEYLSRVADMRVSWDRRTGRLDLDSYR